MSVLPPRERALVERHYGIGGRAPEMLLEMGPDFGGVGAPMMYYLHGRAARDRMRGSRFASLVYDPTAAGQGPMPVRVGIYAVNSPPGPPPTAGLKIPVSPDKLLLSKGPGLNRRGPFVSGPRPPPPRVAGHADDPRAEDHEAGGLGDGPHF